MASKNKKYTFVLKGINVDKIDAQYKLSISSNIGEPPNQHIESTTNINDIISLDRSETITFLDETKKPCICAVTMVNIRDNHILPKNTPINCFWCRHPFKWIPIGCPLRYINNQINKKYTSEITKEVYEIKENVPKRDISVLRESESKDVEITGCNTEHYETDGIFCSFNCCLAFIKDNKHNSVYDNSETLLMNMLYDTIGLESKLIAAPHWRLLSNYGGVMSIDDFRDSFNKVEYISTTVHISPLGMIFEKRTML